MRRASLLLSVLAVLLYSGCESLNKNDDAGQDGYGPVQFRAGWYPVAVGNTWTFIDTSITDTSWLSFTTLTVDGFERDSTGVVQWTFGIHYGHPGDTMALISSFKLARTDDRMSHVDFSPMYIAAAQADTPGYTVTFERDILEEVRFLPISGTYETPAGAFEGCASYRSRGNEVVLCEGVGPVRGVSLYPLGWPARKLFSYSLRK